MATITQTLEVLRLIKDIYVVDDSAVMSMLHVRKRKCFVCGITLDRIGDKVSIVMTGEGNKFLCEVHAEEVDEQEERSRG